LSKFLKKDVNHHIIIIHQDPEALLETFHAQGFDPGLAQGLFQPLRQGQHVPPGSPGTDQEIIGKCTKPLHLQDYRLQAVDRVNSLDRQFQQGLGGEGFDGDRRDGASLRDIIFV
jgi:hypothetical protein